VEVVEVEDGEGQGIGGGSQRQSRPEQDRQQEKTRREAVPKGGLHRMDPRRSGIPAAMGTSDIPVANLDRAS
jgi:hypothetical protein